MCQCSILLTRLKEGGAINYTRKCRVLCHDTTLKMESIHIFGFLFTPETEGSTINYTRNYGTLCHDTTLKNGIDTYIWCPLSLFLHGLEL